MRIYDYNEANTKLSMLSRLANFLRTNLNINFICRRDTERFGNWHFIATIANRNRTVHVELLNSCLDKVSRRLPINIRNYSPVLYVFMLKSSLSDLDIPSITTFLIILERRNHMPKNKNISHFNLMEYQSNRLS